MYEVVSNDALAFVNVAGSAPRVQPPDVQPPEE
jgi:hypothetical protein